MYEEDLEDTGPDRVAIIKVLCRMEDILLQKYLA